MQYRFLLIFVALANVTTIEIGAFSLTNYATRTSTQSLNLRIRSTALHAKPKKPKQQNDIPGTSKGFGKQTSQPKKSFKNQSYGQTALEQDTQDAQSAMNDFFSIHTEWHPLFRSIIPSTHDSLAINHLTNDNEMTDGNIWDADQYPLWAVLPDKPTDSSLNTVSHFLNEWQKSLTDIPIAATKNFKTGAYDKHFLEEGRRTIAVTRFHVVDPSNEEEGWEHQLFRMCWSEMGYLMSNNDEGAGSLVLLPVDLRDSNGGGSLDHIKKFVEEKLIRPVEWLGRGEDWEIAAMERGAVGVRLLYKLGDIPDLSEKYQPDD